MSTMYSAALSVLGKPLLLEGLTARELVDIGRIPNPWPIKAAQIANREMSEACNKVWMFKSHASNMELLFISELKRGSKRVTGKAGVYFNNYQIINNNMPETQIQINESWEDIVDEVYGKYPPDNFQEMIEKEVYNIMVGLKREINDTMKRLLDGTV